MENMITNGVVGIICSPWDGSALTSAVEAAHNAGIPVIAYDALILNTPYIEYYAADDLRGIGALPVCEDDGTLAGMLTDRDIVVRCVSSGDDPGAVTVRSIMSRDPVTVEAGADIRRAMETMRAAQVRRLPVTEGGKLAGILSIDDIARSGRWDMECAQALCGITANVCRR